MLTQSTIQAVMVVESLLRQPLLPAELVEIVTWTSKKGFEGEPTSSLNLVSFAVASEAADRKSSAGGLSVNTFVPGT